jgi:hypothetical protein
VGVAGEEISGNYATSPGLSVNTAGDVNDDGLADFLVGDPEFGYGHVYLLYGPVTTTPALDIFVVSPGTVRFDGAGVFAQDEAGSDVAAAGDTDGDGIGDVLIAAEGAGRAYVVLGPVSGDFDLGAADATLEGGASAADGAGDTNADGYADVVVGSPWDSWNGTESGTAYLWVGPVAGTYANTDADAILMGEGVDAGAGWDVAGVGDTDGDSRGDLLVGAPHIISSYPGTAWLVRGPVAGTVDLATSDAALVGERDSSYAGEAVAGAGDSDGDGFDDLLVLAHIGIYLVLGDGP